MFDTVVYEKNTAKKILLFMFVFLAPFCCVAFDIINPGETSAAGDKTVLSVLVTETVGEETDGKTTVILKTSDGKTTLKTIALEGSWYCLGFVESTKSYMMIGVIAIGDYYPVGKIMYIQENGFKTAYSKYKYIYNCKKDCENSWFALTAVAGGGLKYVAFVGALDKEEDVLMVMDTKTDIIKLLGSPPAPPPTIRPDWNHDIALHGKNRNMWDWSYIDFYQQMDMGVIEIKNNMLTASYGKDKPTKRAKKRKVQTWDLDKLFEKGGNMVIRTIKKETAEKEPYQIWNLFIDICANEDLKDLTDVQKTASLCFWYDSEVQNGGHLQYFENTDADRLQPTIQALIKLGAVKQAEVLREAVQKRGMKKTGMLSAFDFLKKANEGTFDTFDQQYHGCSPALIDLLQIYLDKNQNEFVKII